ncbi:hypothetical protein XENOCAPTIV_003366, partial [Xenoophorus captivus]
HVRIVNGTNRCNGRVELFHDGRWKRVCSSDWGKEAADVLCSEISCGWPVWGTICDDKWGMQEAAVTCREMKCGNALTVKYKAFFGRGLDQVWLDDIDCTGHEKSLSECPHRGFGEHDCDHHEDAGVVCSETVRLINGTDRCSGRVEVFHNGRWGKICSNSWSPTEAAVLCKELSCGTPKKSQEVFTFGDSTLAGFISRCSGNVSSISQCVVDEHVGRCDGVSVACTGKQAKFS